MALWSGALEATQNEDWSETWGFAYVPSSYGTGSLPTVQDAVAFSFVGASATWTIAESQDEGAEVFLQLTSSSGGITFGADVIDEVPVGTITLNLTFEQLQNIPAGEWYENLFVTLGTTAQYLEGPFVVRASVGW